MVDTTKLILLGQLMNGPKTGYEIKKIIKKCISHYADISISSIYYELEQMEKKGLITTKIKHQDSKPSQKIHNITRNGKDVFKKLLLENLNDNKPIMDPLNVGLSYLKYVDKKQLINIFKNKLQLAREQLAFLKKAKSMHKLPRYECLLFDRGIMHIETHIKWLQESIRLFEENKVEVNKIRNKKSIRKKKE